MWNRGDVAEDDFQAEPNGFSLSEIMCLNVITDLCRLLSRGYSHLYRIFEIICAPVTSHIIAYDGAGDKAEACIPLNLYETIVQQHSDYMSESALESESGHSMHYLRYLQALQKLVYLMVIDDYLTSRPADVSFAQWLQSRPEIRSIVESLGSSDTRVFVAATNFNDDVGHPYVETPLAPAELESEGSSSEALSALEAKAPSLVYKHINGLVLNLNSIIKDDYFPGSRNIHLVAACGGLQRRCRSSTARRTSASVGSPSGSSASGFR